jgi:hypothetical protein
LEQVGESWCPGDDTSEYQEFGEETTSVSVQFSQKNGQTWWLTCVYGPQGNDEEILFLQELHDIRAACPGPWMVAGDFSLIYKDEYKNNSNLNRAMM